MNATCPAGIPKPQRVSELGRLLNPEITAPLDSTARGVFNTSMAPAHLQGALSNIHMAPGHLQGALSQPQARRRALRVSLGSTRPTTRAARPVRHTKTDDVHLTSRSAQRRRSFPSPSTSKFSSLPSITISVTPCRTTRKPDDGARRDFACTSTWPHDGALPKHGAPRAASGRVVNLPATRPNYGYW